MSTTTLEAPTSPGRAAEQLDQQVVVLHVGGGDYAVPISEVHEIVRVPEITHVPQADQSVEGVINLRGRVLPVIDLGTRLGLGPVEADRQARVVVVDDGAQGVGLLVDGVSEVLRIVTSDIEAASELSTGSDAGAVRGVAKVGERLVLLLDLAALFGRD